MLNQWTRTSNVICRLSEAPVPPDPTAWNVGDYAGKFESSRMFNCEMSLRLSLRFYFSKMRFQQC